MGAPAVQDERRDMTRFLNILTSARVLTILWLGFVTYGLLRIAHIPNEAAAVPWLISGVLTVTILGLLFRARWGIGLALVVMCLLILSHVVGLFRKEVTVSRLLLPVGLAMVAHGLWKRPDEGFFDSDEPERGGGAEDTDGEEDGAPLISLVHLRSSARYLEAPVLAQALSEAWGLHLTATEPSSEEGSDPEQGGNDDDDEDDDADGWVSGANPVYVVWLRRPMQAFFLVHNRDVPYFDNPDATADEMPNLRDAAAIREHEAWLSVDLLDRQAASVDEQEAYRLIGKAVSALADDQVLALLCPQHHYFNLWSADLESKLVGEEPLAVFMEEVKAPIIAVPSKGDIRAAIEEARRRWPEFVEAFQKNRRQPEKDSLFIVKAAFTSGDDTEHMWLEVIGLEPEYIHGHLMNEPFYHPKLKQGDQVEVALADMTDWAYGTKGGHPVGNFTAAAVNAATQGNPDKEDKAT